MPGGLKLPRSSYRIIGSTGVPGVAELQGPIWHDRRVSGIERRACFNRRWQDAYLGRPIEEIPKAPSIQVRPTFGPGRGNVSRFPRLRLDPVWKPEDCVAARIEARRQDVSESRILAGAVCLLHLHWQDHCHVRLMIQVDNTSKLTERLGQLS